MTQDIKSEIRNQYIGEYMDAAGAKKPGLLGKIWRGVQTFENAVNRWEKEQSWKMPVTMLGVPIVLAYGVIGSFMAAPLLGIAAVAGLAGYVGSYLRADVQVRREAWDAVTRDIDDGKLSERFKTEVLDIRARELEQKTANLPTKGAAVSQFSASVGLAAETPEALLPPVRGIERPHGRNFG